MRVRKAVITAAGQDQRSLPLQLLVDRDGKQKYALRILVEEALSASIEQVCVVTHPDDIDRYTGALGNSSSNLEFIPQPEPLGYGHALFCAREFTQEEPFLHFVSDHLYVARGKRTCAQQLVTVAEAYEAPVSAVQSTHERNIGRYGAIDGELIDQSLRIFRVSNVLEKPSIEEAERDLRGAELRAKHYLCLFGMHVLTSAVMDHLGQELERTDRAVPIQLSPALADLAKQADYLAMEPSGFRCNIGVRFGLLKAQIALVLGGEDRDEVLTELLEVLIQRSRD